MTRLTNPFPLFLDATGALLDAGYIYIGVANADPQAQPVTAYFDMAFTIPAAQPLRTLGGVIVNGATPAQVFVQEEDYSLRILDADMQLVRYDPTAFAAGASYQPLDADLTAIATLATTPYGRSLLTLANQAALKSATGIPDPLPASGGTVTGAISRQNSGRYIHHGDTNIPGDTITRGTTDPTGGNDGDLYFQYMA